MNAAMAERQRELRSGFAAVRAQSLALVAGLSAEDCQLQSMTEASPIKWHLAHATWFFETFVLERAEPGFKPFRGEFRMLFNSYYLGVGALHARPERGMLSRPSLDEVLDYRRAVDARVDRLLAQAAPEHDLLDLIELGLNHEQQHQELIVTDIKHHFSRNPLLPAYRVRTGRAPPAPAGAGTSFRAFAGGMVDIGHDGNGFAYDNETARHRVWLEPYALASRLVTAGEYLRFMDDGGYERPELWLSDGWDQVRREGWTAPLYWRERRREWSVFTLHGEAPLDPERPVCHVSYFEADAFARWADARLPTEAEWEHAATAGDCEQMFGHAWQWTRSAYLPYPGYRPSAGAVGEYNGKFMVNQMVLRGSSTATPARHSRPSYRNFFPPGARWQFSSIRLARDRDRAWPALPLRTPAARGGAGG